MRHSSSRCLVRSRRNKQRGFALASAIFLLVVLASLGAFMMNFSSVQHATSAQDFNGTRAYQAARAGMEWGVYQARRPVPACGAATTLPALEGSLADFTVNVQCNAVTAIEGANTVRLFRITSTASIGGSNTNPRYVERQLQALVEGR